MTDTPDFAPWIRAFQAGLSESFAKIYEVCFPWVVHFFLNRGFPGAAAEDLAQESLLRVFLPHGLDDLEEPRLEAGLEDVDRSWRRFRERLPGAAGEASRPSWLAFLFASPRFAWAVAAVFLVTSIGLTGALMMRPPDVVDTGGPRPRVNFEIAELSPDDVRAPGVPTVRVPAAAAGVVLTLALAETRTFEAYELEIRTEDASLWTTSELRPTELGLFTVEIPRGFLPAGRYRIVVNGREEDQRVTLGTYGVHLVYE